MECATGLTDDEFDGLLARLREEGVEGCPPILGLSGSLRAAVMYMRHNSIVRAAICRTPAVLLLTAEEVPGDCDHRGGRRHSSPLLGLARSPRSVVGQARARGDERP